MKTDKDAAPRSRQILQTSLYGWGDWRQGDKSVPSTIPTYAKLWDCALVSDRQETINLTFKRGCLLCLTVE